ANHRELAERADDLLKLLDGDFLPNKAEAMSSPETAREDLLRGVRLAGPDVVLAARFGLTAALLSRGARALARTGLLAALARHGAVRSAPAIARGVLEPEERDRALIAVATQAAAHDRTSSLALLADVSNSSLRIEAEAHLDDRGTVSSTPVETSESQHDP